MNNASIAAVILTCTLGMLVAVSGEAPPDARVDITRGRLPDSPATEVRACVKALGGQNLKVAWHFGPAADKDGKPVTVHIHRVTGARRVPLAEMKLEAPAGEVNWAWDVPVVKGPARYEATLDLPVPVVLVIEATDRASHEAALKSLVSAKITVTGAKGLAATASAEKFAGSIAGGFQRGRVILPGVDVEFLGRNLAQVLAVQPFQLGH